MFWRRRTEAVLTTLLAENTDLRQQLRAERAQWAEERLTLLDRVLAVDAPAALREVRRAPPRESSATPDPKRRRYPTGPAPSLRPPSPSAPPVPGGSTSSLTDHERQALFAAMDTIHTPPHGTPIPDLGEIN
jgi:hypothetical protein